MHVLKLLYMYQIFLHILKLYYIFPIKINATKLHVHSMDIDLRGTCMVYFKIMQSHWIIQV